jgi:hypothetical protein
MFGVVKRLEAMPEKSAILVSIGVCFGICGSVMGYTYAKWNRGPTFSAEWKAAEIQYMRANNMNPIWGIYLCINNL